MIHPSLFRARELASSPPCPASSMPRECTSRSAGGLNAPLAQPTTAVVEECWPSAFIATLAFPPRRKTRRASLRTPSKSATVLATPRQRDFQARKRRPKRSQRRASHIELPGGRRNQCDTRNRNDRGPSS